MYQDSISLLQPTVLVTRVCGVCPSALRKLQIPISNKIYAVFSAVTPSLYLIFEFLEVYNKLNDITAFIFVCQTIVNVFRHLTSLITPFVFSDELVRFFLVMESVQRSLFGLNIRQPPKPSKRSQITWMAAAFFPISLIYVASFLDGLFTTFWPLLPMFLVQCGQFLKMRVLLDLVHEKFSQLVWHLDDLNDRWPLFLPRPADVSFKEFSSVADFRRTKFVLAGNDNRAVTAEKISDFNKAHLKLVYACKKLERIFSIEGFILTISTALNITMAFYNMFNPPVNSKFSAMLNIGFCFLNIGALAVNLTLVTKIKEKSEKVAVLVHDLLDEDRHAPDVVEELEQFSLALLHRKVTFSAAGFFELDLKLVSKLASLLAPVVLFLVQNQNRPRAGRRRKQITTAKPVV